MSTEYYSPYLASQFLIGLLAGLAATPHCVGMCGGFVLHLARPSEAGRCARSRLGRQLAFHLGRAVTYVFLAALVSALGMWVVQSDWVPGARRGLVYVAAGLTILFGVLMLDIVPVGRLTAAMARALGGREAFAGVADWWLRAVSGGVPALALGLGAGFLPCPMSGALLIAAAGEQSVPAGMLLLAGAGVGTVPGLLATGLVGSAVAGRWRRVGTRALGVVVILVGVAMLARRMGFIPSHCG